MSWITVGGETVVLKLDDLLGRCGWVLGLISQDKTARKSQNGVGGARGFREKSSPE